MYGNGVYEVIGQVMEDMSLKELSSLRFQDGAYDAGVYDKMVSFAHKSPAVFGW